jgi:hypothetical protein
MNGYQPRTSLGKGENGDLPDSLNNLNRLHYFCYLLNAHGVNDFAQTEILTTEPLTHEPSSF